MVQHVILCRFFPGIEDEKIEWIMRETRIRLLKISEVRAIRCGKRIETDNDWGFFFGVEYESTDKMALGHADPIYRKFIDDVIHPHVGEQLALSYEMEPGKDVRYS